jgi:streptogramin lyase
MAARNSETRCGAKLALLLVSSCGANHVTAEREDGITALGTEVEQVSASCWYVFQAQNGDRWFGSDGDGVYRFDGTRIVRYTTEDGLSADSVRGIQGDAVGNVYFTTPRGICRFDGHTFTTLPVAPTPPDGGWRLAPDDLWFQWFRGMPGAPDTEGPYRFDGTSLFHLDLPRSELEPAFVAAVPAAPYSPYEVYSLFRDSRGHLWVGTSNFGACRFDGTSFGWLYEEHHSQTGGGHFGLRAIVEDKDGALWFCNTLHRYFVEPASRELRVPFRRAPGIDPTLTDGPVYFQGALADSNGALWLSPYGGGIWRYDGERIANYPVRSSGADTQVFCIFEDKAGVPWLGTPTAGPYQFDGTSFEPFRRP